MNMLKVSHSFFGSYDLFEKGQLENGMGVGAAAIVVVVGVI